MNNENINENEHMTCKKNQECIMNKSASMNKYYGVSVKNYYHKLYGTSNIYMGSTRPCVTMNFMLQEGMVNYELTKNWKQVVDVPAESHCLQLNEDVASCRPCQFKIAFESSVIEFPSSSVRCRWPSV